MKEEKANILAHAKDELEKERTRNLSIKEGTAASVMSGFTDSYITPYALALGANNAQIGLLTSIPNLFSPAAQIAGSRLMEKSSRKKIIVTAVTFHALMLLPILVLGLFFWKNLFTGYLPSMLIVFYSLYAIFGAIAGPAWFSLLGELVPEEIRGKYFSRRNKICGLVALTSMLIASFILDFFKTKGILLVGFSIIFLIASIFRMISAYLFTKHYYPKFKLEKGYYFSLLQFIKRAPMNNFGRFVIYVALMQFATAIAGPFFAVYMLKDLHFSYTTFMLTNLSASLFTLLFLPLVGKFSDKYGNRELLKFGSILVPIIPIFWLFSTNPLYIILVPQLLSGVGWAAFNFAAGNFIYDSVSIQRRGLCVAYFNMLSGICIFIGAGIGGLIAQYMPISFMNKFFFLFLLSGILRAIVSININKIKETRKVSKPKPYALFYLRDVNPAKAFNELLGDIKKIKFKKIFKK